MANKTPVLLKKSTSSTSGLIAILMTVCTFMLVISFLLSKELIADIRFNQKVISKKNTANSTLKKNVDSLDDLKSNFDQLVKDGPQPGVVLSALPVGVDYAGLGSEYEAMAASSGARLSNIALDSTIASTTSTSSTPSSTTSSSAPASSASLAPTTANAAAASDVLQTFRFRVTATGSYASLQQLTKNMEQSLRPTRIESVAISGAEPNVTAEYVLTSYYQGAAVIKPAKETVQ